jgi:hypothetical protein
METFGIQKKPGRLQEDGSDSDGQVQRFDPLNFPGALDDGAEPVGTVPHGFNGFLAAVVWTKWKEL